MPGLAIRTTLGGLLGAVACLAACKAMHPVDSVVQSDAKNSQVAKAIQFPPEPPDPDYSIWDHGKDCYAALGAPIPDFACSDGDLLPLHVDQKEITHGQTDRCDDPMSVDALTACTVGARLYAHLDQASGVYTVALCRRIRQAPADRPDWQAIMNTYDTSRANNYFQNIAIIQYKPDPATGAGKACFFEIRHHNDGRGIDRIVPPYDPTAQGDAAAAAKAAAVALYLNPAEFGNQAACVRCHDSNLWIRSRALKNAVQDPAKPNLRVDALPTPESPWALQYIGKHHDVWAGPNFRPYTFQIDGVAYVARFHPELSGADADAAGENAAYCTSCHALGKSRAVHQDQLQNRIDPTAMGFCQKFGANWIPRDAYAFARAQGVQGALAHMPTADSPAFFDAALGLGGLDPVPEGMMSTYLTDTGKAFRAYEWMPPAAAPANGLLPPNSPAADAALFRAYYAKYHYAYEALAVCCADPELKYTAPDGTATPVCSADLDQPFALAPGP